MGKLHIQGPRDCHNKPLFYVGAGCPLFLKNKSIPSNDPLPFALRILIRVTTRDYPQQINWLRCGQSFMVALNANGSDPTIPVPNFPLFVVFF